MDLSEYFNYDLDSVMRPKGPNWDIGAFEYTAATSIIENRPYTYQLYQNYPNPFNPSTTIKYFAPFASNVKIVLYDILGRQIRILFEGNVPEGTWSVEWDGKNSRGIRVGSGVYFYQLKTESGFTKTQKMILLK
jgi:hypothetical protein